MCIKIEYFNEVHIKTAELLQVLRIVRLRSISACVEKVSNVLLCASVNQSGCSTLFWEKSEKGSFVKHFNVSVFSAKIIYFFYCK